MCLNGALASMDLLPLRPDTAHFHAALDLYEQIHDEQPASAAPRFRRHGRDDSYRGRVVVDDGDVIGFAYGCDSKPGGQYHRLLRDALSEPVSSWWLADAFEIVELAVAPGTRRRGLGTRLIETILDGTDRRTAVLTAKRHDECARGFYDATGWTPLHEPFVVRGVELAVLGLDLS
ncbi:hypothetical protein BRD04_07525 [Halobacteriales archaeon QS_9_67_17]|nr:MAG: hypothetical protein BRD04_07525 [Halobacteriales archaeon QS_9_67_17]